MKCFYHNDMDGRCAAALVAHYTGNRNTENYFEVDYRNRLPIDVVKGGETVYIVDYSFTEHTADTLYKLQLLGCDIIWIDHHRSSIQLESMYQHEWVQYIRGIRSDKLSGAALVYAWFMNNAKIENVKLPIFVQYVDDYDRWIFNYGEDTTYFKLGIETVDFDALDPIWEELLDSEEKSDSIIAIGAIIKQYIDKDNAFYLDTFGYESKIGDLPCMVVNKKTNSWVFRDKIDDYPVVIVWVYDGKKYNYSIYSNSSEVDCSKIAESYGGGGHKSAAGFSSDKMLFSEI